MSKVNGTPPSQPFPGPQATREHYLPKLETKPWISAAPAPILLTGGSIVDPAASKIHTGQSILIVNGMIDSVFPDGQQQTKVSVSQTVDLQGAYLCPGLIDCHVHITATPGAKTMQDMVRMPDQAASLRSTYVLREMLQRGFTTIRDTGGASKIIAEALAEGLIEGPRLYQCGKALSQTGGHADYSATVSGGSTTGCCGGHSQSLGRVCDGVPQVIKAVRDEIKAGADFIKIMIGGGVSSETDPIDWLQFTPEEVQAITTVCKQSGDKLSTAHAYTPGAIRHAVSNGVKAIEHGNLLDQETAEYMAAHGTFLTPTLSCYGIMQRAPFQDFLSEDGKVKNIEVMKKGLEALKLAEEAGVTVCYGSDLLTSMHALQTEEFTIRSGVLDSPTVLKHATTNAAKLLGQEGKLGALVPGAYADLIVLNANPLDDVTILDRPEDHLQGVVKQGRVAFSTLPKLSATSKA